MLRLARSEPVLQRRAHRPAELGVVQRVVQDRQQRHGEAEPDDVDDGQVEAQHVHRAVDIRGLQLPEVHAEDRG